MVAALQFVAIVAFLIWCLVSSLCVMLDPDEDAPARLVWREHGPAGWGKWREVHFGLTAGDHRVLTQPEPVLDRAARAALLDAVRQQARLPESDAVQYAVVRLSPESSHATVVFASDHVAVAAASPSVDPSTEAHAT
jgi:hypothetical protein